jgi:hypothetical protein
MAVLLSGRLSRTILIGNGKSWNGAAVLTNASGTVGRCQQERSLRLKEAKLQELAQEKKKQEFFNELVPLLKPLQCYIRRPPTHCIPHTADYDAARYQWRHSRPSHS